MSGPPAPTEREVKLGAWPGFRLPDLDGIAPWVRAEPSADHQLDAVYFDAPDLRLARAGITVRHRTDGGEAGEWTAKVPLTAQSQTDALDRAELNIPAPSGTVPDAIASVVAGVLRRVPLGPVAHLQTHRRVVRLRDGGGRLLGEVADDEVSVLEEDRVAARFREVEVEAADGAPERLLALVVDHLRSAGAGQPDLTPKLVRALGPRALAPADPVVPILGDAPSAALVVQAAIASSVQRLLVHDPLVRLDAGPKAVHQARVSTRRLRSDLRSFASVLDEDWAGDLRQRLKPLADALGAVRDADVLALRLDEAAGRLGRDDNAAAVRLLRLLHDQREGRLAELHEYLDTDDYLDLLDRLVDAANAPRLREEATELDVDALVDLAAAPWKQLRKAVGKLGSDPTDEELHAVRIKAKRARYAVEAVALVVPAASRHADALADLQGVLGEQHDAVVAQDWLRHAAPQASHPDQAFAAGLMVTIEQADAAARRKEWRPAWKAASKAKVTAWLN
jgi:CHAD domain-containing protein